MFHKKNITFAGKDVIMRKIVVFLYGLCAVIALFWAGCRKENETLLDDPNNPLADYEKTNKFIVEGVQTLYLWEAATNWKLYDTREELAKYTNHSDFFDRLRYKEDKWSFFTDDIKGLENEFSGISTTFGYELRLYLLSNTGDDVIAVVLYTTPDSPAADAGIKRGDIIVEMNGGRITTKNYLNLYYESSLRLRFGELVTNGGRATITALPDVKNITAKEMYENPINAHKIIDKSGHKIGYLCYTGFQMESEKELIRIFSDFKSAGVQDVVLDLRYNGGGYARTAQILSSILAPEAVVKNKSVYLEHHYNALYTAYYQEKKISRNEYFVDTLLHANMNLRRLYVLTSNRTASASESTMVGLEPYLQLVQVGDTTSGKYCGGILLSPEDMYEEKDKDYYQNIRNNGMYLMIYRFANVKGIDSFTGGLAPQLVVQEDDFDLKPFGDEDDPLLGHAIAHIMGTRYMGTRSKASPFPAAIALPDIKRPVDGRMVDKIKIQGTHTGVPPQNGKSL